MAKKKPEEAQVSIKAPNFQRAEFDIVGTAPFVQLRFSEKAKAVMRAKMEEGQRNKKGKAREPRDFASEFEQAMYRLPDGSPGINASSFRNALIRACSLVNFQMTLAKLTVFVEADGFDKYDGTPLVKIHGTPEHYEAMVRNETGVADIRVRAMWRQWTAKLRVKWDADQFTLTDVTHLLMRVGEQVGIGEGRPFSKKSCGIGFGTFRLKEAK